MSYRHIVLQGGFGLFKHRNHLGIARIEHDILCSGRQLLHFEHIAGQATDKVSRSLDTDDDAVRTAVGGLVRITLVDHQGHTAEQARRSGKRGLPDAEGILDLLDLGSLHVTAQARLGNGGILVQATEFDAEAIEGDLFRNRQIPVTEAIRHRLGHKFRLVALDKTKSVQIRNQLDFNALAFLAGLAVHAARNTALFFFFLLLHFDIIINFVFVLFCYF